MSVPERWCVEITRPAERDIRRLDRPVRERILIAIEGLAGDAPAGDTKRMSGITPTQWRLRVGDWRVLVSLDAAEQVIYVKHVLPRGRAYDR